MLGLGFSLKPWFQTLVLTKNNIIYCLLIWIDIFLAQRLWTQAHPLLTFTQLGSKQTCSQGLEIRLGLELTIELGQAIELKLGFGY